MLTSFWGSCPWLGNCYLFVFFENYAYSLSLTRSPVIYSGLRALGLGANSACVGFQLSAPILSWIGQEVGVFDGSSF